MTTINNHRDNNRPLTAVVVQYMPIDPITTIRKIVTLIVTLPYFSSLSFSLTEISIWRWKMGKDMASVILFGLINTFMVVPVSISFCAIIFRDEAFDEYMPSLVKLVLFSSAVHQACFSLFSSLPFAVGQVQDAGLIFLSAMAGSVATSCSKPENIVPSALFILGLSTSILGVMLMIVSKLRLASVVQYLPMPVIGGYLAFIGFFCGEAGLSMMAGVQVTSIAQWNRFLNADAMILLLPGLVCGLGMSYCLHKFPSPATFPVCLISILSIFYVSMFLSGSSFQDMRDAGWIAPLDKAGSSFDAWKLYDISKVEWDLFPKQIITLLGMFLVVAFSSSLDVAAIEMELGLPLDYNRELNTVGISNLVSGLLGGYTGSYIFTQTTFNMRRGINSRWCGFIVVIGEILIALLPVSVVSFIPKMFFGSLLVLIATELLCEWLIFARTKMMHYEYAVCLLTFGCIQMVGIEIGMLIGVIAAMFCFVISYSNLQSVSAVTVKSSTVIRTFEERSVLIANRGKVLTVSLSGYLFFGSAVKLLQEIKAKLVASEDETSSVSANGYSPLRECDDTVTNSLLLSQPATKTDAASQGNGIMEKSPSSSAFAEMTTLQTTSHKPGTGHMESIDSNHHVRDNSSYQAGTFTAHSNNSSNLDDAVAHTPSHHHPMKLLFSSHSLRQKHIPTVYDLSADQIQSHYESWSNAQKPSMERKPTMSGTDRRPSSSDLEMGPIPASRSNNLFVSPTQQKRKHTSPILEKKDDAKTKTATAASPAVNERTSLLTAAINSSYSKDGNGNTLSTSLTNRGLEDVKEIRESSVFLQVWESQQQRKEQQKRRRSYSDLSGLATSPGNPDGELIEKANRGSLGYNFDSQERLDNLDKEKSSEASKNNSGKGRRASYSAAASATSDAATLSNSQRRASLSQVQASQQQQSLQSMIQETQSAIISSNPSAYSATQDMVTEYLILDFTGVMGVDATAARACFLTLVQFMRTANVTVVFAHLSTAVEELLRAHSVLNEDSIIIPNLDDALEWCEDQILIDNEMKEDMVPGESMASRTRSVEEYSRAWSDRQQHSLIQPPRKDNRSNSSFSKHHKNGNFGSNMDLLSLTEDLSSSGRPISARALRHILVDYLGLDLSNPSNRFRSLLESSVLTKFFTRDNSKAGDIIFDIDFPATKVFFIESGTVEIVSLNVDATSTTSVTGSNSSEVVRVNKASHGGVFGEADFILGKNRTVRAYSVTDCTFWILDREHFAAMEVQQPQLCMLIQYALLRSLALSYTCSMYALHPTTAYADNGGDV